MTTVNDARETRMKESLQSANRAELLLAEINALKEKILTEFPLKTFGLTTSEIKKAREIPALVETLRLITNHPKRLQEMFDSEDRRLASLQKEKEEKERRIQKENEESQIISEAIAYLLEKRPDLKIGVDYTIHNALDRANDVAFELAVNAQIEEIGDDYIEFYGDTNCEDCQGWNGSDHRCDCGNRRVEWTREWDFSFKEPNIFAEAY